MPLPRTTADTSGIVAVGALVRADDVSRAFGVDGNARVALLVGTEGISQDAGALVAQVVFAIVVGRVPFAAFQQDYAEAGFGKLFGDDAASGAATDHNRVYVLERHSVDYIALQLGEVIAQTSANRRIWKAQHLPTHAFAIASVPGIAVVALHGVIDYETEKLR